MQLASALLGGPDADAYFTAVVTDADSEQWPFEHAMARLQYAAWLRRSHQEQPARAALHAALDTFTQLGIPIMKAHTAAELRASGVATAPPAYGEFNRLTPQQQSIVRLVASGLHNPEVAARLHLSTHTVRSHLYRLFPRLGVTDRAQLRNVVPHGEAMA
jgi:DNA-binding NarL/FixJ family response regulator